MISTPVIRNSVEAKSQSLVPRMINYGFLTMLLVAFFVGLVVSYLSKFVTPGPAETSTVWTVMLIACSAAFLTTIGLSIFCEKINRNRKEHAGIMIAEQIKSKYGWEISPDYLFRHTMDNQIELPYRRIPAIANSGQKMFIYLSSSEDNTEIEAYRDPMSY